MVSASAPSDVDDVTANFRPYGLVERQICIIESSALSMDALKFVGSALGKSLRRSGKSLGCEAHPEGNLEECIETENHSRFAEDFSSRDGISSSGDDDSNEIGKNDRQRRLSGLQKSHTITRNSEDKLEGVTEGSLSGRISSLARTDSNSSTSSAKDKWKQIKHSIKFANQMAAILKTSRNDILDDAAMASFASAPEPADEPSTSGKKGTSLPTPYSSDGFRPRGRTGLEGLEIKSDKSLVCRFTDTYVSCLKLPLPYFTLVVFSAPLLLAALFCPIFLLDINGLSFGDSSRPITECHVSSFSIRHDCAPKWLTVFLYALSLSTTFGGSPVSAASPFTILVANVNTLFSQFLFVFLSGAVFARMSQPGRPVRCSKKAIIRSDDILPTENKPNSPNKKNKVFAMRLVLVGPPPCELVDVKITLTFRIFLKLPSGSFFCSTTDLPLVRQDVAYLRYGIMCRHVIDENSAVWGHTHETLLKGDASFSLSIVAMERTSMQTFFHKQDYFVHDGDVVWDGDFHDFIYLNERGIRVLDHSRLDLLKHFKVGGLVSTAIARMSHDAKLTREREKAMEDAQGKENGVVREERASKAAGKWLSLGQKQVATGKKNE